MKRLIFMSNKQLSSVIYAIATMDGVYQNKKDQMLFKFHSAAKPFQMLPFLSSAYKNPFLLTEWERVILASSHLGQDVHIQALESILKKAGINKNQFILPLSEPMGRLAKKYWIEADGKKQKIYHPCFGKHLGYVLYSMELGEDPKQYYKMSSKVQKLTLERISNFIPSRRTIEMAWDQCGVPTYLVTLSEIADAYLKFVMTQSFAVGLIQKYPVYLEGDGSLGTELIKKFPVIAKTSINRSVAIGDPIHQLGIVLHADSWPELTRASFQLLTNLFSFPEQDITNCCYFSLHSKPRRFVSLSKI